MALIPCPECKTEISESAVSCPRCGFPIAAKKDSPVLPENKVPMGPCSFMGLFFKMWTQPRPAIREILGRKPFYGVWVLILAGCFLDALDPNYKNYLEEWIGFPKSFFLAFLGVMVSGIAIQWLTLLCFHVVGKIFGGKGSFRENATAMAWTSSISVFLSILKLVQLSPYWVAEFFPKTMDYFLIHPPHRLLKILTAPFDIGIGIWALVVTVLVFSETNRFSIRRSVASVIVVYMVIIAGLIAFAVAFPGLFKGITQLE